MDTINTFEIVELVNGGMSARIVVNMGNTLFSLCSDKDEKIYFPYSLPEYKSNTKLAGNPFMHPWANRLEGDYISLQNQQHVFPEECKPLLYRDGNGLPLHGLLLKSDRWKTIEITRNTHVAEFIFRTPDLTAIFPYEHTIQIRHELTKNGIYIETILLNHDEKPMPVSFGFHPYFLIRPERRADYRLTIPAEEAIEVNDVMIPTGKFSPKTSRWNFYGDHVYLQGAAFDDGFHRLKRNGANEAEFALNELQIIVDENYPFAQIYAPDNIEKPYVCIEPMTAATNALNIGTCPLLPPGEVFRAGFKMVV